MQRKKSIRSEDEENYPKIANTNQKKG
jgi:DNA mismatch repair protein MSH6